MRTITQLLSFAAVVGFIACSQVGCASAKGVGDEKSAFNGTQTILHGDPVAVSNATKLVATELQLTVVSSTASGLDGKVIVETANKKKVAIDLKTAGEGLTRVTVRSSGFGGDKTMQKHVLDRIKSKLPVPEGYVAPVAAAPKSSSKSAAKSAQKPAPTYAAPAAPAQEPTNTAHLPF